MPGRQFQIPKLSHGALRSTPADILIHTEKIIRVVFSFHFRQPLIIFAVRSLNPIFIFIDEIDVNTPGSEGLCSFVELTCPRDTYIVLIRCVPASMYIHDEL